MQKSIAKESPRRRIARRVGAAGIALAAALVLPACDATGGGYIGEPLDGGPVSVFKGDANFGFNFTCEMRGNDAQIKGQITYHDDPSTVAEVKFPEIRLHGTVDPFFVESVASCAEAVDMVAGLPVAQFQGDYRSQDTTITNALPGRFTVQVFDQGEPGRTSDPSITGDSFTIDLVGGPYAAYTRGGYIEGGNIQVDNT